MKIVIRTDRQTDFQQFANSKANFKFEKSFLLVREAGQDESIDILDVDPRRDDDASPMSSYGCMLRPT